MFQDQLWFGGYLLNSLATKLRIALDSVRTLPSNSRTGSTPVGLIPADKTESKEQRHTCYRKENSDREARLEESHIINLIINTNYVTA